MYKGFPAIDLTKWGHPQVTIIPIPGSVLHNVAPLPRLDKREEARVVHPRFAANENVMGNNCRWVQHPAPVRNYWDAAGAGGFTYSNHHQPGLSPKEMLLLMSRK